MRRYPLRIPRWVDSLFPTIQFRLNDQERNSYALTFDDGPHPDSTPQLLELLAEEDIKATFFLIGQQAERFPTLVEEIKSQGHTIGSHGYLHLDGWKTVTSTYIEDIQRAAEILETNLFRPPYGRLRPQQYATLKHQYQIVLWSFMPGDFDSNIDVGTIDQRLTKYHEKQDIIVLHDQARTISNLQEVLPAFISSLCSKGMSSAVFRDNKIR